MRHCANFLHTKNAAHLKQNSVLMQTKNQKFTGYARQIHEATSAPYAVLPTLEQIMREDIFHSTLDWQTKDQLDQAAREAYRIYQKNPQLYDWEQAVHAARWQRTQAENALQKAELEGDPAAIDEAQTLYALAQESYETAYRTMQQFA
jgi:hypothetical protein